MVKFLSMPYLVQKAVLERMGPIELFDFSRLSKRMKNKVKNQVRIRNVDLLVFVDNIVGIHFVSTKDRSRPLCMFHVEPLTSPTREYNHGETHRNIGELNNVPSAFWNSEEGWPYLSFYSDDYLQGAKTLYKELVELFSVPTINGTLELELVENEYPSAVKLFIEAKPRFIQVDGGNVDFEVYMWTLENLPSSEHLDYEVIPKEHLEREMSALDHEGVRIGHGFWMRPKHLELMLAARQFEIKDSSFSGTDVNRFLNRLRNGSHPNLKKAYLYMREEYEHDNVLEGLNATEEEESVFTMQFDNGDSCEFRFTTDHGVEIEIKRTENAQ